MRPTENIFSLDALEGAQVAFAFASELNQPLARVWETAADTDRLNRAAGLPPMEFDRTTHDDGVRLRASLPLLGMKVSFEAPLTTIRAPHGYAIERTFKGGAVETYRVTWTFEALDLKQVLDRDVEHLSGGELQRFAIAVVAAQEADVYMVDEPSSYLDVRQRLKAAQVSW